MNVDIPVTPKLPPRHSWFLKCVVKLNEVELFNLKQSIVGEKSILLHAREALYLKDQVEGNLCDVNVKALREAFSKAVIENDVNKEGEKLESLDTSSDAAKIVEYDKKILRNH